jgi:YggT family protein
MTAFLIGLINVLYYLLVILILARLVFSFISGGPYELRSLVYRLTEPLLAPVRRLLPPLGGLDFSPLLVLIVAQLLRALLIGLLV